MKTLGIILLAVVASSLFSCSSKKTIKHVTIYTDAKIFSAVERESDSYNLYLLVPADTNHDGLNDIRIRISPDRYISSLLFPYIRQVFPNNDILVEEVTYVPKKGSWRISGDLIVKE